MKIGFPVSENLMTLQEPFAPSFHHTSLFGIYDVANNTIETIDLAQEDHSMDFAALLKEYEIKAVISPEYSIMVLKLFKIMNIDTYRALEVGVIANIQSFSVGKLSRYTFLDAIEASKQCDALSCGSCHTLC
jgi:predicted Fe-Mo cluster-binding NifX family protein